MLIKPNNTNSLIDLVKIIGSIMIFTMHIGGLKDFSQISFIQEILSRWCVPFFFITSSYFLFCKNEKVEISHFCKRIALLYLLWFVFNIPSIAYIKILSKGISRINIMSAIKECIISDSFKGSWYLSSTILSALFVYLLSKKVSSEICMILAFPLYVMCCLSSVYAGVLPLQIREILVFLCFPINIVSGIFYFSIGKYLADNKSKIHKIGCKNAFSLFVTMFILYIAEVIIADTFGYLGRTDVGIFIAPSSTFLLIGCLNSSFTSCNSTIWRKISIILFCAQGNVIIASELILWMLHCRVSIIKYLVGTILMILINMCMFASKGKIRFIKFMM